MTQEHLHAPGHAEYQTEVTIGGNTFWADPDLVPLLQALADAGLVTRSHCAGHKPTSQRWVVLRSENITGVEVRHNGEYQEVVLTWKPHEPTNSTEDNHGED